MLGYGSKSQYNQELYMGVEEVNALVGDALEKNNKSLAARLTKSETSNNDKFVAMETRCT